MSLNETEGRCRIGCLNHFNKTMKTLLVTLLLVIFSLPVMPVLGEGKKVVPIPPGPSKPTTSRGAGSR